MINQTNEFSKKSIIWTFSILLAISFIFNVFLLRKSNDSVLDKMSLNAKNNKVVEQLQLAKSEINKYKGISVKLDDAVKNASRKLEEKENKLRLLLSDKKLKEIDNKRLMHEIDSIKEKYFDVIDSLLIANQLNKSLNNTLSLMSNKIDELNTKLGYASRLDIENLTVQGLRTNFANKEIQTAIAKRTVKLKICFDLLDNKVTDPGMKDIYIRILTPNAEVLTDSDNELTFMHPELRQKAKYTLLETVNYKNQKMNICVKWEGTDQYESGLYIAEVFTKDNKLGVITFTLK